MCDPSTTNSSAAALLPHRATIRQTIHLAELPSSLMNLHDRISIISQMD